MEDGISGGLQHRYETCCEKGGRCGRRACIFWRRHHRGDVVFQTGGPAYDTDEAFTATDVLISQLFVVAFVHPTHMWITLIWGFLAQLSL